MLAKRTVFNFNVHQTLYLMDINAFVRSVHIIQQMDAYLVNKINAHNAVNSVALFVSKDTLLIVHIIA